MSDLKNTENTFASKIHIAPDGTAFLPHPHLTNHVLTTFDAEPKLLAQMKAGKFFTKSDFKIVDLGKTTLAVLNDDLAYAGFTELGLVKDQNADNNWVTLKSIFFRGDHVFFGYTDEMAIQAYDAFNNLPEYLAGDYVIYIYSRTSLTEYGFDPSIDRSPLLSALCYSKARATNPNLTELLRDHLAAWDSKAADALRQSFPHLQNQDTNTLSLTIGGLN